MTEGFIGSIVSIDCGNVLGTYQGQVDGVDKGENTVTIAKCYRNGIQCKVPKVTLCAADMQNLKIIKNATEANSMPEIRQKHAPVPGKVEYPEGSVALARASSADLHREEQSSPVNSGSYQNKPHRSRSIHETYSRSSPVKTLYGGFCNGQSPPKAKSNKHSEYVSQNGYHNNNEHRRSPKYYENENGNRTHRPKNGQYLTQNGYSEGYNRTSPQNYDQRRSSPQSQYYDENVGTGEHISRMHEHKNSSNSSTPRKMDKRRQPREDWFSAPVDTFLEDDFDFEKNLALFDKKAVFQEIENHCDYNQMLNSAKTEKPTKYRHDENILSSGPVTYRQIKVPAAASSSEVSMNGTCIGTGQEYVTDTGLVVPCISHDSRSKLMDTAEKYGLRKARQLEMIGRSASEMVLQLVGGSHRFGPQNSHQQPTVVVLCGPHLQGAMGVNCARQLAVHNVQVTVFAPNFVKVIQELEDELKLFDLTGGKRTSNVKDLPVGNIDIIVNAMDNHDNGHLLSGQTWYKSIVEWANQNRAAVLAIDPPAVGGAIDTKWSMGLVLPLLHVSERCGQIYLCDLGIPTQVFQEEGILYKSPFANKFLIPLHAREI